MATQPAGLLRYTTCFGDQACNSHLVDFVSHYANTVMVSVWWGWYLISRVIIIYVKLRAPTYPVESCSVKLWYNKSGIGFSDIHGTPRAIIIAHINLWVYIRDGNPPWACVVHFLFKQALWLMMWSLIIRLVWLAKQLWFLTIICSVDDDDDVVTPYIGKRITQHHTLCYAIVQCVWE